jgi:hypothetical protein
VSSSFTTSVRPNIAAIIKAVCPASLRAFTSQWAAIRRCAIIEKPGIGGSTTLDFLKRSVTTLASLAGAVS